MESASKSRLIEFADDWRFILVAYVGVLLPWAALQAFDYISEKWKSVRRTFVIGLLQALASLICLAYMVFYVHLQRISKDFKEMAAAIYGCLFCLFHVSRIFWGLLQLWEWRKWTKHAFDIWKSLREDGLRPQQKRKDGETYAVSVNSSLVDNKFTDAELPYRLAIKTPPIFHWKDLLAFRPWKIGIVPQEPAETIIRWCVTFIGYFGTEWLLQEGENSLLEQRSTSTTVAATKRDSLAEVLGKFLVCNSAGYLNGGLHFSLFGMLHAPYADALPYCPVYQNVPKTTLPFGIETKSIVDMNLGRFRQTVRSAVESLDSNLMNQLSPEEATAVQEISPWHVYSFLQLMQYTVQGRKKTHEPFYFLKLDSSVSYAAERISHQLGYSGQLPSPIMNLIESLYEKGKFSPGVFQVQLDNILALRSGKIISNIQEKLGESDRAYAGSNYELVADDLTGLRFLQTMRFQGVMMEYVRFVLQRVAASQPDEDQLKARTVSKDESKFSCSGKLKECLLRVQEDSTSDLAWQMVPSLLILEVQDHLGHELHCLLERSKPGGSVLQESLFLQALFLVSFPSVRMGKNCGKTPNGFEFFIEPVDGAESLCVKVEISKSTLDGKISIVNCDEAASVSQFSWDLCKTAFLHRIRAQSEWRQARHASAPSQEWTRSNDLKPEDDIYNRSDKDVGVWRKWPPFNPGVCQDEKVLKWMKSELSKAGKSELWSAVDLFWERFCVRPRSIDSSWAGRLKIYRELNRRRGESHEALVSKHNWHKGGRMDVSEWINILMNMRSMDSLTFEFVEEFSSRALGVLSQLPGNTSPPQEFTDRAKYLIESDLDWASFSSLACLLMETVHKEQDVPEFLIVALESMLLRGIEADECGDTLGLCLFWNARNKPNLKKFARLAFRHGPRQGQDVTDNDRISTAKARVGRLGQTLGSWIVERQVADHVQVNIGLE